MIGVLITILLMVGIPMLIGVYFELRDAFGDDRMHSDVPQEQEPEMDNSEFDWGHNVKHRMEEEL